MDVETALAQAKILFEKERYEEALSLLKEVSVTYPRNSRLLQALGMVSSRISLHKAVSYALQATEADPNNVDAHFSLAHLYLAYGNYERGFLEYEWRLKRPHCLIADYIQGEYWDGRPLEENQPLLLHCEQGLGDAIQFIRFLPEVRRRVQKIYLASHPELVRLFSGFKELTALVTTGQPVPACSYHCPLLSLPRIFKTTLETLPTRVPYLPLPTKIFDQKSASSKSSPRIGFVWRANRAAANTHYKSLPLETFSALADLPAEWISLQKDPDPDERALLQNTFHAEERGSQFRDFQDTADCLATLDFVISIDTSVIHLAGALARPAAVLLPKWADWRWMNDRSDSPWYPTVTLFRQIRDHDWSMPLNVLRQFLQDRFFL